MSQLPTVEHGYCFEKTALAWIDQHECSEAHEADIRATIRRLVKFARPGVTLGELAQLMSKYRKAMEDRPRGFNKALMNVRSFLRHSLGRDHVLYRKVASIPQLKERKRGATGLPLWKFMELLAKLPVQHQATALSMAVTGMRPDEYFSMKWEVKQDRVSIYGTKRAASRRDVPLWHPVTAPTCSKDYFNRLMQQAGTVPYVCRKSFAHWMEEAGIPRARRNIYRAHESVRDMGDLYEKHEVTGYLVEDAERLSTYAKRARKPPKMSPNRRRLASLLVSKVVAA